MSFLQPVKQEGIDIVFHQGEEREIEWECDFSVINIRLWQEDPQRTTARPGATILQNDSTPLATRFTWKVNTYDHDITRSNLYFLWAWETTDPSDQDSINTPEGPLDIRRFTSPYFIIEQSFFQVSSSSSSTNSGSTSSTQTIAPTTSTITTASVSPTNTTPPDGVAPEEHTSNVVKIAVPVSVVVTLLLGILALFWWWRRRRRRRRRRSNKKQHDLANIHEAASSEVKKPAWDGKTVEMAAPERPVELAVQSRSVDQAGVEARTPVELE
ncbi:hypothetical protein B0H66DRAFT_617847 [Apodospora peruviana]|uniref:Uncharacterized protein n=1 Tax=Apodospora peruviana TaxID=516989 RepID=A0AAE0MBP6_9PEZI|nr:hypothetical protein B0H66DRAFT_617847 [Apodospora peruviana]